MMTAMAKFTDLRAALIVGGAKNVMSQVRRIFQRRHPRRGTGRGDIHG
jgi:hypothetical protein